MPENENIMDRIERVNRGVAYQNYFNFLSQYIGTGHPILSNPRKFFYVVNHNLRCLGSGIEINVNESISRREINLFNEEYFPTCPLDSNIIPALIKTLYAYLSQFSLSPYEKTLFNFKWQCGLQVLPYFDELKNITVMNRKIYLMFWDGYGAYSPYLLTDALMRKLVTDNGGKYLASHSAKTKLATAVLDQFTYENETIADHLSVSFSEGKLSYTPSMEMAKFDPNATKTPSYKPYLKLGLAPTSISSIPTNNLQKVLTEMTGGSLEELDSISELIARMMVQTLPSKYLWNLSGIGKHKFANLLSLLCDAKTSSSIYETKGKHLYHALNLDSANHSLLQINRTPVSRKQICETNRSTIKKLIQGTNIPQMDDPFIPDKQEYLPLVAIIQSEPDFDELFKKISCKTITIGDFNLDTLTDEEKGWLKLYLTARGLHLIYKTHPVIDEDAAIEELISDFLSAFCIKDDTEPIVTEKSGKKDIKYTKTKDLCNALMRYAAAIEKANLKILKHPTLLAKKIKAMGLVEKEYRATGNTNCFMGIVVAEEKLFDFIQKKNQANIATNTFGYALDSISNLIQFEDYWA